MARSTCNPHVDVPKGMMRFEVINSNIKDSLGQYCVPGDMAVLDKRHAQGYLDQNLIKVVLPDFGVDDESDTSDEKPEDPPKRAASQNNSSASDGKGKARASADS